MVQEEAVPETSAHSPSEVEPSPRIKRTLEFATFAEAVSTNPTNIEETDIQIVFDFKKSNGEYKAKFNQHRAK